MEEFILYFFLGKEAGKEEKEAQKVKSELEDFCGEGVTIPFSSSETGIFTGEAFFRNKYFNNSKSLYQEKYFITTTIVSKGALDGDVLKKFKEFYGKEPIVKPITQWIPDVEKYNIVNQTKE